MSVDTRNVLTWGEKGENMTSHLSVVGRGLEWESGDLVHFGTMTRKRS